MKKLYAIALVLGMAAQVATAGNDTKRGQAGATELLINPWARSTGWNGANSGSVRGIESMSLNIAGLAYVKNTDLIIANQRYLSGSGINILSLGFGQRLSPTGVLGMTFTSLSLGDFIQTTYALPEGTNNTFSPSFFNFGLSYAKTFSSRITGGLLVRGIYQGISNAQAFGVAFDAGIQYQSGPNNEFKFGVALRNVGPKLQYSGEGLSFRGQRDQIGLTLGSRVAPFEMPAMLNIGASYDFNFKEQELRLTPAFNFTSNSYTNDNLVPGVELAFREMFMLRASYMFRQTFSVPEAAARTDVYTGLAAGATIELPLAEMFGAKGAAEITGTSLSDGASADGAPAKKKSDITVGIDYSYRPTNPFSGTHGLGFVVKF